MDILENFQLTPGTIILMIIGLVELLKSFKWVQGKERFVSFLLGALFGGLYMLQGMYPQIAGAVILVVYILTFGLVASGLWDAGRKVASC